MRVPAPHRALAFWALAGLAALAPTPASAVVSNQGTAQCRAPQAGDTVTWNGTQFCAVEQGSGGGGGTGGTGARGSAPGNPIVGTGIWASADAPRDPVVECLRRNPRRCLADQVGSRGLAFADGEGRGKGAEPGRGSGSGSAGSGKKPGETGSSEPTREECRQSRRTILLSRAELNRLGDLIAIDQADWERFKPLGARWHDLEDEALKLKDAIGHLRAMGGRGADALVADFEIDLATVRKKQAALKWQIESPYYKPWQQERDDLYEKGMKASAALFERCKARYGDVF